MAAHRQHLDARASLEEAVHRALGSMDLASRPDADIVGRVERLRPGAVVDGWSWRGEPAAAWFGDAAAIWLTEDRGEAGERGAGGPFVSMALLAVDDVAAPDARAGLVEALHRARAADADVQRAFRDCWRLLVPEAVMVPEHLGWIDEIPAGESRDARSWRALPRLDASGRGRVSVLFEEDAQDPRASALLSMATFIV